MNGNLKGGYFLKINNFGGIFGGILRVYKIDSFIFY